MSGSDPTLAASVRATELGRALRDVIAARCDAAVAERILHAALTSAGRARFPTTPGRLRDFVHDDLYEAISDALGAEAASAVIGSVEPILASLEAATRLTRSTAPAPRPREQGGPAVAILGDDPGIRGALSEALAAEVEIHEPRSVPDLRALRATRTCVVLIDVRGGVSATLARLGPALAGTRALAWGDDAHAIQRVRGWLGEHGSMLAFSGDDTPRDLALVIEAELDP